MATKTFRLDPANPPKLSAEAKARYDATQEAEIEYRDIPDMGDVDWQRPGPKPTVTMRLDEDVIGYFKSEDPKGYTRRMASVLTAFARRNQQKPRPE